MKMTFFEWCERVAEGIIVVFMCSLYLTGAVACLMVTLGWLGVIK